MLDYKGFQNIEVYSTVCNNNCVSKCSLILKGVGL